MKTKSDYFVEDLQKELDNKDILDTAYKAQVLSADSI